MAIQRKNVIWSHFILFISFLWINTANASWENRGGNIKPAGQECISWGEQRLDCFGFDRAGNLQHTWTKNGETWGRWESLGGAGLGLDTSGLSCLSWSSNRIDCFTTGRKLPTAQGSPLYHIWWSGSSWGNWENLGGELISRVGCTSWGRNRLDCFAVGADQALNHIWWDNRWGNWESVGGRGLTGQRTINTNNGPRTVGFPLGGDQPECLSPKRDRIHCFIRNSYHELLQLSWDGRRWRWNNLGGTHSSKASCTTWDRDRIDCFTINPTNNGNRFQLAHIWSVNNRWADWELLGGDILGSELECMSFGYSRIDCFTVSKNRKLYHIWWHNRWGSWEDLNPTFARNMFVTPSCVSWGWGRLDCFAVNPQGELLQAWWGEKGWKPN